MSMAEMPSSNCGSGDTLLNQRRLLQSQKQKVSRSGLVYGSSFSRGSTCAGAGGGSGDPHDIGHHHRIPQEYFEDMWYDSERFQLDHINEVLTKLNDGSLDDEIWGKIVVMERCKRIAKAYLRKTTVIVDGGDEEFDGKTLGFNFFSNPMRDEYTKELKAKIGDGVIIKMDNQGNIKAMARGSTPIFVQGWKDAKCHCISDKVIRNHGKLMTKSATSAQTDEDRVVKIFDMRRFKQCVERDPFETDSDARNLLLKSCVRVALVKDGGANDPVKTPCWFMIINLVALDMLKTKLPTVCSNPILTSSATLSGEATRLSRIMSQISLLPPSSNNNGDLYSNPALTHLIAAAMQHQQHQQNHYAGNMSGKLASSKSAINMEQIAKLASTLSLANPNLLNGNYQAHSTASFRRSRRSRSFSDSDDSEIDGNRITAIKNNATTAYSGSTTGSSSGISGFGDQRMMNKRFASCQQIAKSVDALHDSRKEDSAKNARDKYGKATRPRLSENLFQKPLEKSCASTTSDYDSNKEIFDSGSWSSNSRVSSKEDGPRSYSPSIPSDAEHHHHHSNSHPRHHDSSDRRNSAPHEIANAAAFIARQRHHQLIRRVSSTYDSKNRNPYKPVYTKRNTLPTKGTRKIRRAISRRDIDQKQPSSIDRTVSPKPLVPIPSTEETEPPTTLLRTAVCNPIQRNNLATTAPYNAPDKSGVGNNCSDNNNLIVQQKQQQQPIPKSRISTQQQHHHQQYGSTTMEHPNAPQPNELRDHLQRSPHRLRKESSTDSEVSDVQFETEEPMPPALTRQQPIRRAMAFQGVGAYAGGTAVSSAAAAAPPPPKTPLPITSSTAPVSAASTISRKFNFPKSPPATRVRTPIRALSQSATKYTTTQQNQQSHQQQQQHQQQPSENRINYDAQSLRPWKTRRGESVIEQQQQGEKINFIKSEFSQRPPQAPTNANATRIEPDQFIHHNGAYNPTLLGQPQNSTISRMPRRTSSKESRIAMSSEQSSFRERAWNNNKSFPYSPPNSTAMAPTIQRWLTSDQSTNKASSAPATRNSTISASATMETSHSNFPSKTTSTASKTNIWRHHRNGPWDELLASKQRDKERNQQQQQHQFQQQQQHHQRRESCNMGMEGQRIQQQQQNSHSPQISAISNSSQSNHQQSQSQFQAATNVRSLRNYYTELHSTTQNQRNNWNQQQQALCSPTILSPRMKRLQNHHQQQQQQQQFHHSYHQSMDIKSPQAIKSKEIPKDFQQQQQSNRFCQFQIPPPPPPPPQRLASIVPLQSSNFCINKL